ncbi:MAG: MFS transporter [Halobacteriaceae archaeon]
MHLLDRQRALVALAAATRYGGGVVMGTGLAVLVERAGGSPFAVSLLFPAYFLPMVVFAPAWGAVADVTGRRRAVLLGTGALATLSVLPLFALDGVWPLIGARGLYAVFAAGFPPVMLAVVSDLGGRGRRGRELGFFNSARASGFTGGQLAAGTLLGLVAPAGLYLVVAGLSAVATLAVLALSTGTTGGAGDRAPDGERGLDLRAVGGAVRERLLPSAADRAHLHRNGLAWLYVALALRNATVMGVMSLLPVYLTGPLGVPEPLMGVVLAANPASQVVFMTAFGRVADARGRRPLVVLGMVGGGAFAVLIALASLAPTLAGRLAVALAAAVLIGASFSAMTTGALAFIGDVAPDGRESELMGLRTTAKGVGAVLGAPAFGGVATVVGYAPTFAGGSVLAFAAAWLAWDRLVEPDEPSGSTETAPAPG